MIYIPETWLNDPANLERVANIIGDFFERDIIFPGARTYQDIQKELEAIGEGEILKKLHGR